MVNLPNLVLHKALGNTTYSSDPKLYMNNKNKPLWDDFNSLIEQAVVHQKASLYSDLNEEMKWALAVTALPGVSRLTFNENIKSVLTFEK